MEADKAALAIKIKNLNPNRQTLKCADCPIRGFCLKGCLGS
jgi:radical SAM protein with 4Fe4S-binding SPASM domain